MGVKNLWGVLTPYSDRKPISVLRNQTVAIDLAGWVCESLNTVDYTVHPQQHLKNLFFRTCYLLWEKVKPIFVLEGKAPQLKTDVMKKRNDLQFRGVKPKPSKSSDSTKTTHTKTDRSRFNCVLKKCEEMLRIMGIKCVKAPGEAEAYCAYLNEIGIVDGIISQDSDCVAYGAKRIYRNFTISGNLAGNEGFVDLYDMDKIYKLIDIGQNKAIVMALICGCDYCPEGIEGAGRDGVLKLFTLYKDHEILDKIRKWHTEEKAYKQLEQRVNDKTVCDNCGHIGRKTQHNRNGCGMCNTTKGCDTSTWKEERSAIKFELIIRRKALTDPSFPNEEIIHEFMNRPKSQPDLQVEWCQPNIVAFIRHISVSLQWPEIYSFQKFLPLLTRWHVSELQKSNVRKVLSPKDIIKKRTVKGTISLEVLWKPEDDTIETCIPDEQKLKFVEEDKNGGRSLWTTIEPFTLMEQSYGNLVEDFLKRTQKPKKPLKKTRTAVERKKKMENLIQQTSLLGEKEEIIIMRTDDTKKRRNKTAARKGLQLIDKYFKKTGKSRTGTKKTCNSEIMQCSTPISNSLPSDLESDIDNITFDCSNIIDEIVSKKQSSFMLTMHHRKRLHYNEDYMIINKSIDKRKNSPLKDDLDAIVEQRNKQILLENSKVCNNEQVSISLDDSFDVLVKTGWGKRKSIQSSKITAISENVCFPLKKQLALLADSNFNSGEELMDLDDADTGNCSFYQFNNTSKENVDPFERYMEINTSIY